MGARIERLKRTLHVGRVARQSGLLRVLGEIGVVGDRPATREGARRFRLALEELGTTYIKLGQLLSSRPDLLPDVYIEELDRLVDQVPPVPFAEIDRTIREELPDDVFTSVDPEPLATAALGDRAGARARADRRREGQRGPRALGGEEPRPGAFLLPRVRAPGDRRRRLPR
ncbi:MAG: hypothetical protein ABI948_01290 [Thermoleophilia bacterium]